MDKAKQTVKKAGLFFGTFNPIHIGHLIIASYMAEFTSLDEVWLVLTPKSPFKQKQSLLDNNHRYQMIFEAIQDYPNLKVSKVEFELSQPNYTVHTLAHLEEEYKGSYEFSLIMGADNLSGLHKWKNYQHILDNYQLFVYPRIQEGEITSEIENHPSIQITKAPIVEVSSSFIRKQHALGKDIRSMLPEAVWRYMDEMNFYR